MPIAWELQQLADWYGVETSFRDDRGNHCEATPEAPGGHSPVLGAPIRRVEEAADARRQRRQELWRRVLEPVSVAWDGWVGDVTLRLPASTASSGTLVCRLEIEDGEPREWSVLAAELPVRESAADVEGVSFIVRALPLPGPLPAGYHRLHVQHGPERWESTIISAPVKGYAPPHAAARTWGVFLPTYAIRSGRNWGAGDFTDLEKLIALGAAPRRRPGRHAAAAGGLPRRTVRAESLLPRQPPVLERVLPRPPAHARVRGLPGGTSPCPECDVPKDK